MARRIGTAVVVGSLISLAPAAALAEHDHTFMMSDSRDPASSEISAGVSIEAAQFDNGTYIGSYQGVLPQISWMRGRFGASATIGLYHLEENGLAVNGIGDAMATAHVTVWSNAAIETGVAMHVMVPTGSELENLGMGHAMAMPSAWGVWRLHPVTLTASAGYNRALISLDGEHHDHGPMPLVDPMNLQEVAWNAGADVELGAHVHVGGHLLGGIPIGMGINRVVGGGRVAWGTSRVSTGAELQLGLAGDPFSIRGVVETALRF
ncbi:MAG TPA: hypothetical protein VH165_10520 [Kofleriaceae bacterium]|jgi:hypothetical protein|nr:hypothetical protein [Kofleriaceae bacterium]